MLSLGEDAARGWDRTWSVPVPLAFWWCLRCGAAVALAGPVAFVGLMVPHVVVLSAGITAESFLVRWWQAFFMLAADILSRWWMPPADTDREF